MDPIPADLFPFYKGGYEKIPSSLSELREQAIRERYRLDPILKYKSKGKLLEIGPWRGVFSCNAKDAGFDVTAIEQDLDCVDFLQNVVGIRALQSSDPVRSIDELQEQFDVIVLWHSLEHLRTPWLVIQKAAQRLAPGGILLVAIPNIESYEYSVLKAAWKHLDAPRHLYFFPIDSLAGLCQRSGLSTVEMTTSDELSDALSRDTWHSFASSLLPVKYLRGALALLLRYATLRKERKPRAGAGLTAVFRLEAASPPHR